MDDWIPVIEDRYICKNKYKKKFGIIFPENSENSSCGYGLFLFNFNFFENKKSRGKNIFHILLISFFEKFSKENLHSPGNKLSTLHFSSNITLPPLSPTYFPSFINQLANTPYYYNQVITTSQ